MSESSEEQLKPVDQTAITNESIDVSLPKQCKEKKSTVAEDEEETINKEQTVETSTDPLIRNTREEEAARKDVVTTDVAADNVVEDKNCNTFPTTSDEQTLETNQPKDLLIENPQEKDCLQKEAAQSTDCTTDTEFENVNENKNQDASHSVQDNATKEKNSNTKICSTSEVREEEPKASAKEEQGEHVTYAEDGTAIYTDPKTNYQYRWCTKENNWIPIEATTSTNAYENEHYKWCSATQKWIPKHTQVIETEHYKWDADKNEWVAKFKETTNTAQSDSAEIVYDIDEDGQRTYTDKDGMVFFWDAEKNAWFPKIDEDFMARYQMSYGFIDNTSESESEKEKRDMEAAVQRERELARMVEEAKANEMASEEATKQGLKRKQPQEPPKWFEIDPAQNTKVYVSKLPLDITLDEFADVMGKCGMIMRDPQNQKYKLKLYTESDGQIKGDGLCDYIKVESVDLALKILDEYDLRGHKIRVQRAQFQMRGEYNPALKPKRKKKDKEKLAKIKEKLFDWRPEKMRGERSKHEKTVIIKNLFHPNLFEKEVQLILDYQNDLREECSKCGTVRKVVIYDRHSAGVAQVNMSSPEEADLVIQMMHGRFFGKRQLTAEHWDGKTKYKIEESEAEIQKRLNKWDQYLEAEENKKSDLHPKETEEVFTEVEKNIEAELDNQSILEKSNTDESSATTFELI